MEKGFDMFNETIGTNEAMNRSLDLIRALMDMVEVEPGDDGTVVRMRKRLAAPVAAPAATASTAPGSSPM